jgi:hypothetical protein
MIIRERRNTSGGGAAAGRLWHQHLGRAATGERLHPGVDGQAGGAGIPSNHGRQLLGQDQNRYSTYQGIRP